MSSTGRLANIFSIRWRLPLTYAAIALLAALALGGLLLLTLEKHYDGLERQYLDASTHAVLGSAENLYRDRAMLPDDVFQSSAEIYSFLVRSRVRLLGEDQAVIADSGPAVDPSVISLNLRSPAATAADQLQPGVMAQPLMYETFLSVQGEAGVAVAGTSEIIAGGDGPLFQPGMQRYPMQMPPTASERVLFGLGPGERRTDLSITVPVHTREGDLLGYLELSESPAFGQEIIDDVAGNAILAGGAAVLLAALAGWFASRQISQPVVALAETTRRMAEGDLSVRVSLQRRDEFGTLGRRFNMMAEQVENTVTTLRRFVADAAHEINTPITALRTNLELAGAGITCPEAQADIARAQAELKRLETLTQGLLTLSRLEAHGSIPRRAAVDLAALARQAHEHHASRAEQAGIAFALDDCAGPLTVSADEAQLCRVLDNLLDNALKFTPSGGTVTLGVAQTPQHVQFWVADTGIGIPAEDLPRLFGRFHRGRNAAAYPGNGLGLAITQAIVEDHAGRIEVMSGAGTRFTVSLPRDGKQRQEQAR